MVTTTRLPPRRAVVQSAGDAHTPEQASLDHLRRLEALALLLEGFPPEARGLQLRSDAVRERDKLMRRIAQAIEPHLDPEERCPRCRGNPRAR